MRSRSFLALAIAALLAAVLAISGAPQGTERARAATCADHPNQAAAQAAKDTRDADGDGIYCESLPCPCAGPGSPGNGSSGNASAPSKPRPSTSTRTGTSADPSGCIRVGRIVDVGLSRTRYPAVRSHWEAAIARGYPRVLTVHRRGADRRRRALLAGYRTRAGYDRDEYPMAMARTTVRASVRLVPSSQNRGAGSVQGTKLRRYCSGQRFRIVWY